LGDAAIAYSLDLIMANRVASRKHDRDHFYKYMSLETAMKVVASHSFRWSSPLHFNDPFDHQAGFIFPFASKQFSAAIIEQAVRLEVAPEIRTVG
jgi:hypothetical protein